MENKQLKKKKSEYHVIEFSTKILVSQLRQGVSTGHPVWRWPCGWESAGDRGAAGRGVSPARRHGPSRHRKTAHVPRHVPRHAPGHVQFLFQSLRFALSKQAKTARHRSGTRTTNSGFRWRVTAPCTRDRVAAWPYCKASLLCPGHPRSIHTPTRSQVTKETRE